VDIPTVGDRLPRHLDWVGYDVVDDDNLADVLVMIAGQAESDGRDFSPFEFTAREINDNAAPDDAWTWFDDGVHQGIVEGVNERLQ
jgi:hypothetical protein